KERPRRVAAAFRETDSLVRSRFGSILKLFWKLPAELPSLLQIDRAVLLERAVLHHEGPAVLWKVAQILQAHTSLEQRIRLDRLEVFEAFPEGVDHIVDLHVPRSLQDDPALVLRQDRDRRHPADRR